MILQESRGDSPGRLPVASLGTYAESSPTPANRGFQKTEWDQSAALVERYALQAQARKAMFEVFYRVPKDERPKRPHKVVECRRSLRPVIGQKGKMLKPAIFKHKATGSTFYGGHIICASGRACPLCAIKIGETKAEEIRKAVTQWMEAGGICLFVTLTFPHYRTDTLHDLVDSFQGALTRFRKGRVFDVIKQDLGYEGVIRALETTWGEKNGFHPHSHEIWFVRPDLASQDRLRQAAAESRAHFIKTGKRKSFGEAVVIKERLYAKWLQAVTASGLSAPSAEYGLRVDNVENEEQCRSRLAEYMTKAGLEFDETAPVWGADDELVKLHTKKGKPDRYTPFDFLREQFNPENSENAKTRFRALFAEFVEEFSGMAQVFWSSNLKGRFDFVPVSEEEAANSRKEEASLLLEPPPRAWAFVIGIKGKDFRAQLLNKAREGGKEAAIAYLGELLDLYYLEHYETHFEMLEYDAQYLLALPDSAFISMLEI